MNTAAISALGAVDSEESARLGKDAFEGTGLVSGVACLDDVTVHRIARPDDRMSFAFDGADECRQPGLDLVMAIARDERHAPRNAARVERVEQTEEDVGREARPDFDADRVANSTKELDMRRPFETGAITDPEEMRARVIPVAGQAVLPCQRLLVRKKESFVAGIELRCFQLRHGVGIDTAGRHEIERFADAVGHVAILLGPGTATHEVVRPRMNLMQVRVTAARESAEQVQCGGGLVIRLHHPLRIGRAPLCLERDVVDDVTAIGRQLDAFDGFGVGTARLGELAGHAAEFHGRQFGGKGQDNGHLEQHSEGVADVVGVEFGEGFGAVTALKQECFAADDAGEVGRQVARFAGKHQRREIAERRGGAAKRSRIGVGRKLERFMRGPAGGCPFASHSHAAMRDRMPNCNAQFGTQLPWKPGGMRWGMVTTACGCPSKSCASMMTRSVVSVAVSTT